MKKIKKRGLVILAVTLLVLAVAAVFWLVTYYPADDEAIRSLEGSGSVEVMRGEDIVFNPKNQKPDTGLIFYPGGKVAPEAYGPLCSSIAEKGYRVIIVPMPLKLAIFGGNKAEDVIKANPDIKNWAIGGHSLGGVMASAYAYNNSDVIKGLILLASYPQDKHNLSDLDVKAASIWGSKDGVAKLDKINAARSLLPKDAVFYEIQGGNHGQFGNYGFQKGDNQADIGTEEQQNEAVGQTIKLLEAISK